MQRTAGSPLALRSHHDYSVLIIDEKSRFLQHWRPPVDCGARPGTSPDARKPPVDRGPLAGSAEPHFSVLLCSAPVSRCTASRTSRPCFGPMYRFFGKKTAFFVVFFRQSENRDSGDVWRGITLHHPGPYGVAVNGIYRVFYIISAKNTGPY